MIDKYQSMCWKTFLITMKYSEIQEKLWSKKVIIFGFKALFCFLRSPISFLLNLHTLMFTWSNGIFCSYLFPMSHKPDHQGSGMAATFTEIPVLPNEVQPQFQLIISARLLQEIPQTLKILNPPSRGWRASTLQTMRGHIISPTSS